MILLDPSLSGPTTSGEKIETRIKISFCFSFGIATVVVESGYVGCPELGTKLLFCNSLRFFVPLYRYSLVAIMYWKVRIAM
jgi:hypothetical protein